jgi:rod shape-determining protein MreD
MTGMWRSPSSYAMVVVLVLSVVVQGTLFGRIRFFGASPELLVAVIVCWSLLSDVASGLLWAFLAGVGIDLIAGIPLGASSLALMPVAFLGGAGRNSVYGNNALLPVTLVLLATPLHGLIMLALLQVRQIPVDWLESLARVILPAMVLNALLMLPVMALLRWLHLRLEPARAG